MTSANTRNLIQAISIHGNVVDRYFAVTSETPRNTVEVRINAMPRNGRSARAGALRVADFFSGKGSGALSSLAAAAGGGVTVELGCKNYRIGRTPKNDNCAESTRPENRKRICAIARGKSPSPSRQLAVSVAATCHRRRGTCPRPLKHFVNNCVNYSIGRLPSFGPRGKALSSAAISSLLRTRSPAAAFAPACSGVEAFGIANTKGSRVRKARATWRGVASRASAIFWSTSPALLRGEGKSL